MTNLKIIVQNYIDGYVAYPIGLNGSVVGQGDTYDHTLSDVKSPDEVWHDAPAQDPRAETQAVRERFERHFGEVDLGYSTGVDNEGIDADLATEYAGTDPPN